jgi:hypothetical protein
MITENNQITGKTQASLTKILQLIGGITATFIVIKMVLTRTLTWDIFAIYLAYVASVDSFNRFLLAKYGIKLTGPLSNPPNN